MPGERLTQQDRKAIAAGLAEGLGYRAIARRLNRPTSTITREVARNGGPDRYRADFADRATARRARRGKPLSSQANPAPVDDSGRDPGLVLEVVHQLGTVLVQTGLPRIVADLLACLYATDSGGLTSAELVRRLNVSPASISKAVGYLEAQELIRRERDERRERYVIDSDIWYRSLLASAARNAIVAEAARSAATSLGAATPAGVRLTGAAVFLERTCEAIVQAVRQNEAEGQRRVWARDD